MASGRDYRNRLQQMLRGYRHAQVLIACANIGLFQELAGGGQPIEQLAARTGTSMRALQRLLNAAVALELLRKEKDLYVNAPMASACLAEDGPYYMGNSMRREGAFYLRWGYLTEAVRSGERPEANVRDERSDNWVLDFELALYDLARVNGPAIAAALELPTDRPLRLIDVGGGHGGHSMAICRHYPNVEAVVFELPAAAEVARRLIGEAGMDHRVSVEEGDFQKQELGSDYDVALLFGVLVSERPSGKLELLRKTHRALAPGGRVVVRGACLSADRTAPLEATLFSLHMLLSTEAGDISTWDEMQGWLQEAGFVRPRLVELPEWAGSDLQMAEKAFSRR